MSVTVGNLGKRIVLPPEPGTPERQRLQEAFAALRSEVTPTKRARLAGPEGGKIELPDELYEVVLAATHALLAGRGVSIAPLSTQEAAIEQRARQSRRTALRELTQDADDDGLYEIGTGFVDTR